MSCPMEQKGLSVIICCYNSEGRILKTLIPLFRQASEARFPVEIIIVDNNSSDDTVEVIQNLHRKRSGKFHFHLLREVKQGLMNARKRGLLAAKNDITVFLDDDNVIGERWLETLYRNFRRMPDVGVVGGRIVPDFGNSTKPCWFDEYQAVYACGEQYHKSVKLTPWIYSVFGAGLSIRTRIARRVMLESSPMLLMGHKGGKLLRGDDTEICLRAILEGWHLFYDSSLLIHHWMEERRLCWEYVLRAREGGGRAELILMIYKRIIRRNLPKTRYQVLKHIIQEYIKTARLKRKGRTIESKRECQFRMAFLKGFTAEYIRNFVKFGRMVATLMEAYSYSYSPWIGKDQSFSSVKGNEQYLEETRNKSIRSILLNHRGFFSHIHEVAGLDEINKLTPADLIERYIHLFHSRREEYLLIESLILYLKFRRGIVPREMNRMIIHRVKRNHLPVLTEYLKMYLLVTGIGDYSEEDFHRKEYRDICVFYHNEILNPPRDGRYQGMSANSTRVFLECCIKFLDNLPESPLQGTALYLYRHFEQIEFQHILMVLSFRVLNKFVPDKDFLGPPWIKKIENRILETGGPNKQQTRYFINIGSYWAECQEYDKALAVLSRAEKEVKDLYVFERVSLYFHIGRCYKELNKGDKAMDYLTRCLKLQPGHSRALEMWKSLQENK